MRFNILPIFGRDKEKKTLELFKVHVKKVQETRKAFHESAEALFKGNFNDVAKKTELVLTKEREADDARSEVIKNLFEGAFLPATRSRLYTLSENIDEVADEMQNAANQFVFFKGRKVPKNIMDILKKLVVEAENSIDDLEKGFNNLFENKDLNFKQMKKTEETSDALQKQLFEKLYLGKKLDPITVSIVGRTGHLLSKISNEVEDSFNQMSIIKLLKLA